MGSCIPKFLELTNAFLLLMNLYLEKLKLYLCALSVCEATNDSLLFLTKVVTDSMMQNIAAKTAC